MLLLSTLAACLEPRPAADPGCVGCHGSETSPAPPKALGGFEAPTVRGVGAHSAHLTPASARALACTECHDVPASVDAPGHNDTPVPAEVRWGESIGAQGASPYDAATGSCTVYCHGATVAMWTDPATGACGTCHGRPPPPPDHPQDETCPKCHTAATAEWASGDPARHVDGVVDFGDATVTTPTGATGDTGTTVGTPPGCDTCHGQDGDGAPPPDTLGNTDTTLPSVGAHQTHVDGTAAAAAVACDTCHLVPKAVGDPGHIDTAPAEVALPAGAYTQPTCAGTSCHGPATPDWTRVGQGEAACGSCHGLPPGGSHPPNPNCENCHPPAGPNQTIDDPASHVDGTVDL